MAAYVNEGSGLILTYVQYLQLMFKISLRSYKNIYTVIYLFCYSLNIKIILKTDEILLAIKYYVWNLRDSFKDVGILVHSVLICIRF